MIEEEREKDAHAPIISLNENWPLINGLYIRAENTLTRSHFTHSFFSLLAVFVRKKCSKILIYGFDVIHHILPPLLLR